MSTPEPDRLVFNRAAQSADALADTLYTSDLNRKLDLAGVQSNLAIAEAINNLAETIARVFGQPDQPNGIGQQDEDDR